MNRRMTCLAVICAVALSGCGVQAENEARIIDPPRSQLAVPASIAPGNPGSGTAAEPLYFVRDNKLVAVIRRTSTAPTLQEQVRHLVSGPTDVERRAGLSSALQGTIAVEGTSLVAGRATISIGDDTDNQGSGDQVLAFGQLVCTLTTRPDVDSVAFEQDGRPLGVPRADGSLFTGGLTAADYTALTAPA